jgi:hypothetical protein
MSVKITDNKKKFEALKKQLAKAKKNKPHVAVGILQKEGSANYADDATATVVDVATWNEFGTDTIPARSFLRSTYDANVGRFLALIRRYKKPLALQQVSMEHVLGMVGQFAQSKVDGTIVAGGVPYIPNAPSTIADKGSSSPLIRDGQMRQSIRYEVRNAK